MLKKYALILFLFCFSFYANAKCNTTNPFSAEPILIDLSELLYSSGSVTQTYTTNYQGEFECTWVSGGDNKVKNISLQNSKSSYIKLNDKNIIKVDIINIANTEISFGKKSERYSTSKVNTTFTIKMELYYNAIQNSQLLNANGDSQYRIDNALIALDASSSSLFDLIIELLRSLLVWKKRSGDLAYQPIIIKFVPKQTTCYFNNSGLTVTLPNTDRAELINDKQIGSTSFSLDFSCNSLLNGKTNNPITTYLSSSSLSTDRTIMLDKNINSVQGVGISLKYQNKDVKFGAKQGDRNGATLLIDKKSNDNMSQNLSIPLVAYYNVYDKKALNSGPIKTTAILNMEYF